MPTASLPLFHSLLHRLNIPLTPPTLAAIPPLLLLVTLERILRTRLPLGSARQCKSAVDELVLVKCLLGVMADDELGIDLSAVDPTRVVSGEEDEMGVIIMALVVIAKRRGLDVSIDRSEGAASIESVPAGRLRRVRERNGEEQETQDEQDTGVFSMMDRDDDTGDISVEPLEPDYTVSSPIATPALSPDVFGSFNVGHTQSTSDGLFARSDRDFVHQPFALPLKQRLGGGNEDEHADFYGHNVHQDGYEAYSTPMPRGLSPVSFLPTDLGHRNDSHPSRRTRHAIAVDKVSTWREDSQTTLISASGLVHKTGDADSSGKGARRTVLQDMMDEFGLG